MKNFETVKSVITYIREIYNKKITLDEISKAVLCDKYALCREFKRLTGQTIIENLNNYRCINAMRFLNEGYTVAKAAELCGFDNLSFFTKTFKKYIGKLPSEYKKWVAELKNYILTTTVQVLPERHFGRRISIKFNFKKQKEKTQKPFSFWFFCPDI